MNTPKLGFLAHPSRNEQQQLVSKNESVFSVDEDDISRKREEKEEKEEEKEDVGIQLSEIKPRVATKKVSNVIYSQQSDESEVEVEAVEVQSKHVQFNEIEEKSKKKKNGQNDTQFQCLILRVYLLILAKKKFLNLLFRKFFIKYPPSLLNAILNKCNDKTFDNESSVSDLRKIITYEKMKDQRSLKRKLKAKGKVTCCQKVYGLSETVFYNLSKKITELYYWLQKGRVLLTYVDFTQNQNFRVIWDILYLMIVVFQCYYIPLYITFNLSLNSTTEQWVFNNGPLLFLTLDILLNFVTGYFSKGVWISDYKTIAKHYVKNFFIIDLITIVPQFLVKADLPREIQIIFMLKFIRLRQVLKKLEDRFMHLIMKVQTLYDLTFLFVGIMYMSHLTCCLMYYISKRQFDSGESTMFEQQFINAKTKGEFPYMYVNCLYFSVVTIVTVGYGDFSPKDNQVEKIYVMGMILVGCGQHAYSISTIGNIIADLNKDANNIRYKIGDLNTYMLKNNVPKQLMVLVRKNLEYVLSEQQSANSKINELLPMLDTSIAKKMKAYIYGRQVNRIQVFRHTGLSRPEFLEQLADITEESTFAAETEITRKDDIYLYFLEQGSASIQAVIRTDDQDNLAGKSQFQSLTDISAGSSYNAIAFFSNQKSKNIRLMAKRLCKVLLVPRSKFIEILRSQNLNEENLRFNQIKDNININKNILDLGEKCHLCSTGYHEYIDCPTFFYKPSTTRLVCDLNQPTLERRDHYRKPMRPLVFPDLNEETDLVQAMMRMSAERVPTVVRRQTSRFIVTEVKTALIDWRQKNISFLSADLQMDFRTNQSQSQTHLSDDYSLYSEDDVILERQEEHEDEEQSSNLIESLGRNAIRSSQLKKVSRQVSRNIEEDEMLPNFRSKNSILMKLGLNAGDPVIRQSSMKHSVRLSKHKLKLSQLSPQILESKETGSFSHNEHQSRHSQLEKNSGTIINERHEKLELLNKGFKFIQTFNLDQYCNFGKGYQEHNDISEVIKKVNQGALLKLSVLESQSKALALQKQLDEVDEQKRKLNSEPKQDSADFLKKSNKLIGQEKKYQKLLHRMKAQMRVSQKQELQYIKQQEGLSMRMKKILFRYNPLLQVQKISLNYRHYLQTLSKYISQSRIPKKSMIGDHNLSNQNIQALKVIARKSNVMDIRASVMQFQKQAQQKQP